MGGGKRSKSSSDVVLKTPRPKHKNGAQMGAGGGTGNAEGGEAVLNRCKTFELDRPKVASRKATVGMAVYAQMNGRSVEVRSDALGTLGLVPSRTAAEMLREDRKLQWNGSVVKVDSDRLSIGVTLCPE